jgi:hypothetical protein
MYVLVWWKVVNIRTHRLLPSSRPRRPIPKDRSSTTVHQLRYSRNRSPVLVATILLTCLQELACVYSVMRPIQIHLNMIQNESLCLELTVELFSISNVSCIGKAVVQLESPFFWGVIPHHWMIDGLDPDVSRRFETA